jgi:hypothetical protein
LLLFTAAPVAAAALYLLREKNLENNKYSYQNQIILYIYLYIFHSSSDSSSPPNTSQISN